MQRREENRREIWVNKKGKQRGGEEHYEAEEKGTGVYKRKDKDNKEKTKEKHFSKMIKFKI